jgi:hypothetical protein
LGDAEWTRVKQRYATDPEFRERKNGQSENGANQILKKARLSSGGISYRTKPLHRSSRTDLYKKGKIRL